MTARVPRPFVLQVLTVIPVGQGSTTVWRNVRPSQGPGGDEPKPYRFATLEEATRTLRSLYPDVDPAWVRVACSIGYACRACGHVSRDDKGRTCPACGRSGDWVQWASPAAEGDSAPGHLVGEWGCDACGAFGYDPEHRIGTCPECGGGDLYSG